MEPERAVTGYLSEILTSRRNADDYGLFLFPGVAIVGGNGGGDVHDQGEKYLRRMNE